MTNKTDKIIYYTVRCASSTGMVGKFLTADEAKEAAKTYLYQRLHENKYKIMKVTEEVIY